MVRIISYVTGNIASIDCTAVIMCNSISAIMCNFTEDSVIFVVGFSGGVVFNNIIFNYFAQCLPLLDFNMKRYYSLHVASKQQK